MMDSFGLYGFGMWLVPLLLVLAVFYFANENKKDKPSPKDILDKRYANGEIDTKEYKERLEELKKGG